MKVAKGFTLTELVVTVGIVAILTAIAYSSYLDHIRKVRRSEARVTLLHIASQMEQYFSQNNTYATATIGTGAATDVYDSDTTPDGWYLMTLSAQTATSYTLQAAPQNDQVYDTKCGTYTYDSTGTKGESGTETVEDCW